MAKFYSWNDITKIYMEGIEADSLYVKEGSRVRHYAVTPKGLHEIGTGFYSMEDIYNQLCKSGHVKNYILDQEEIDRKLVMMELIN